MQTGGNALLSGQQKQENVPAGYVINIVAAFMDCNVSALFSKEVYKPMDFDIDIGNDIGKLL